MTYPSNIVPYWLDDTYVVMTNSNWTIQHTITDAEKVIMADIGAGQSSNWGWTEDSTHYFNFFFPEPITLDAFWLRMNHGSIETLACQYSTDSTAPGEGAWTNIGNISQYTDTHSQLLNGALHTFSPSLTGILAIRFQYYETANDYGYIQDFLPFGYYEGDIETLLLWDPTVDQIAPEDHFNYTIAQGGTWTQDFRIKNPSTIRQANGVVVSTGGDYSNMAADIEFSTDGGSTWGATASVGTIAANSISNVVKIRRVADAAELVDRDGCTLEVTATSFS